MKLENSQQAFFALVKAGLWEQEARLLPYGKVDYEVVMRIAEEQSVVGLVTAGLEHVQDVRVPQDDLLQFIGQSLQIEQQNKELNNYLARLIEFIRKNDVFAILVKGQGVALCYEKPLWRGCGDIDLLLSHPNYERAKQVLLPLATEVDTEYKSLEHLGLTMEGAFVVELHGMLHSRLSTRIDRVIDEAQRDCFLAGNVRIEEFKSTNGSIVQVYLPAPDNDVIFVFTHILKHFYIGGLGLRQICDWCRLLWRYRSELDLQVLESRIRRMGLMTEWKAFGAFAVEYLGMPVEAMPFYDSRFKIKGSRIMEFVLETGNMGHNREIKRSENWMIGKIQAAWFKMKDFARHTWIFPLDSVKFFLHYLDDGIQQARVKKGR